MTTFSSYKSTVIADTQSVAGTTPGAVPLYDDVSSLPYIGNSAGDRAFVKSNDRLYIWEGSGWYNVALVNRSPAILSVEDSNGGVTPFTLDTAGAVTTITITATDSDGDPITFSATADSDFNGLATISQDASVFTITPLSEDSATTQSGTITFTATDGVNISTDINTFTLTFNPSFASITQVQELSFGTNLGFTSAVSGDTVILGEHGYAVPSTNSGRVHVYTRDSAEGTFTEQATLQASDAANQSNPRFGYYVDLDGDTAVIGAYGDDDEGGDAGAAYVFKRSGSSWTQSQKLFASDAQGSDRYGFQVAISSNHIVVGAYLEDYQSVSSTGSAYVYARDSAEGTFTEQQKIFASDYAASDQFGEACDIDGDTIVVSSTGDDPAGAAYVFTRSGSTWTQQQKLTPSDGASGDQFGKDVVVSGDIIAVGAQGHNSSDGAVYFFKRSGSTWSEIQKITHSGTAEYLGAQHSMDISSLGDIVIVGAPRRANDDGSTGGAYIFRTSDGGNTWNEQSIIDRGDPVNSPFLYSASIDGDIAVGGAYAVNTVYIFRNT